MPNPVLIYVDTCVYVDLIVNNPDLHQESRVPRWKSAKALFHAVNDNRVTLAASSLVDAEISCMAALRDGGDEVTKRIRGWLDAESTRWTDVDRFLARDAAALARDWHQHRYDKDRKLGGADAIHLAAAVRLGCAYLMTHDGGFPIGKTVNLDFAC